MLGTSPNCYMVQEIAIAGSGYENKEIHILIHENLTACFLLMLGCKLYGMCIFVVELLAIYSGLTLCVMTNIHG